MVSTPLVGIANMTNVRMKTRAVFSFSVQFLIVFEIHGVEKCVTALGMTTGYAQVAILLPNAARFDGQGRHSRSQGRHGRQRPSPLVRDGGSFVGANARLESWLPNPAWREAYYVPELLTKSRRALAVTSRSQTRDSLSHPACSASASTFLPHNHDGTPLLSPTTCLVLEA